VQHIARDTVYVVRGDTALEEKHFPQQNRDTRPKQIFETQNPLACGDRDQYP
jgi:hypothetical protein